MKKVLVLIALLLSSPALATTYYVDTNAAAGGNGTTSALTGGTCAWDTVADVNGATFLPGDTILFRRGCTWAETLTIDIAGTANNVITYSSYGAGAAPIINAGDTRDYCIIIDGVDYVTITGITAIDSIGTGGIFVNNADYCTVSNCLVSGHAKAGIYTDGNYNVVSGNTVTDCCSDSSQAITHEGTYGTIKDNLVYLNHNEGIDVYLGSSNVNISNNIVYSNASIGIYVDSGTAVNIYSNLCYENGSDGIRVGQESATEPDDIVIYHNICRSNIASGILVDATIADNHKIYNNVCYNNGEHGLRYIAGTYTNIVIKNNILYKYETSEYDTAMMIEETSGITINYNNYYQTTGTNKLLRWGATYYTDAQFGTYKTASGQDANSIITNPVFFNPISNDFRLLSSSLAINAGTATNYRVCVDSCDMGVKEYDPAVGDPNLIIKGSNTTVTTDWHNTATNQWSTDNNTYLYDVGFVLFGIEAEANVGSKQSAIASVNAAKEYLYDATNNRVTVYSPTATNPVTYYSNVEVGNPSDASGLDGIIELNGADYITIEDVDLKYGNGYAIKTYGTDVKNLVIQDVNVSYCGGQNNGGTTYGGGIQIGGTDVDNVLIQKNSISQCWDEGIGVEKTGTSAETRANCVIRDNVIDQCSGGINLAAFGSNGCTWSGIDIYNNKITNSGYGWSGAANMGGVGINVASTTSDGAINGVMIHSNYIESGLSDGIYLKGATAVKMYGNYMGRNAGTGIFVYGDNTYENTAEIYNNFSLLNIKRGLIVHSNNGSVVVNNNYIIDNEISGGNGNVEFTGGANLVGCVFKNNVISSSNQTLLYVATDTVPTLNYNCYYRAVGQMISHTGNAYTLAQFAAYQAAKSQDANSIATNPLVNSTTYYPNYNSPLINVGDSTYKTGLYIDSGTGGWAGSWRRRLGWGTNFKDLSFDTIKKVKSGPIYGPKRDIGPWEWTKRTD